MLNFIFAQTYHGSFEVALEGLTGPASKQKNLSFDVQGEGNLPRVSVLKPSVRNKKGTPILLFSRLLLRQTQRLPLTLKNEGTLPSKVSHCSNKTYGYNSASAFLVFASYYIYARFLYFHQTCICVRVKNCVGNSTTI